MTTLDRGPVQATADSASTRVPLLVVLRALLLLEAVLGLGVAVFLSALAVGLRDALGGEPGLTAEQNLRFAAAAALIWAIAAAIASRGVRRRRPWGWTWAAVVQLILAVGTAVAVMLAEWHPAYLVGFGLAAVVMIVLSVASVRRALGQ